MTEEQKELLYKDLCARLPYRVKGNFQNSNDKLLKNITIIYRYLEPNGMVMTGDIKPYLFPLSSMTTEQRREYTYIANVYSNIAATQLNGITIQDWFNKNHFDYRGLIEKGLAIDATGLNIY